MSRVACFVSLACAALAASAFAAEVVVKNDSFVSGGPAVVVGNFAAGEHAGVRLTSPCNGTIVAVQIGWLSQPQSSTQSLERNVFIYADGAFPTPGPVLAQLEAPLLTSGALNEFRYLDENQTIPLAIPVSAGERFFVTLQFDNPTSILTGTPSVFRDTDGCTPGSNVLFAIPGGWINFCTFLAGDLVIRAVVDCAAAEGACCLPDGSCEQRTSAQCGAAGGAYQGDFTQCGSVQCPEPVGACCFESTGGCIVLSQGNCAAAGGSFRGGGTDCNIVCFPEGACCLPDGSCAPGQSPEDCDALGGVFQGDGTDCSVACPDPQGACCFSNGFCLYLTEQECGLTGAQWLGHGTNCDDISGNGIADDCEEPAGCPADLDGSGSVDLADLLILLGDFGCSGACPGDVDGDGQTGLSDLLELLGSFGSTCA